MGSPENINKPFRSITREGNLDAIQFSSLIRYFELLKIFSVREISSKFKDSTFGILWLFIHPLAYVFIITLFFSHVGRSVDSNVPYPIYLFLGIIPFMLFNRSLSSGSGFLRSKSGLLRQIYVPSIVIVTASFANILIEFLILIVIVSCSFIYFDIGLSFSLIFMVPLYLFFLLFCYFLSIGMSVLGLIFADLRLLIPTLSQFLFFGTPIFYSLDNLPSNLVWVISINPLLMFSELGRYFVFGYLSSHGVGPVLVSFASCSCAVLTSIYVFRRIGCKTGSIL